MPPIAGVTQGAMVLDDGVIQNLTHTNVVTALRPKVDGSIHLDEVLSDHPLDFFVYFSSGAFVTGRMGQANYTAANAYMVSAAARRRTRGLAGSVLHLGPVVGVGYVERIDRVAVREGLIKTGYNFMSESDFHAAFAEAVLASPSDAGHDMEVVTCVRSFSRTDAEKPVWSENPRMSHLCVRKAAASSVNDGRSEVSVKSQLLDCVSRADVHRVIQGQPSMLFMPWSSAHDQALLSDFLCPSTCLFLALVSRSFSFTILSFFFPFLVVQIKFLANKPADIPGPQTPLSRS